MVFQNLVFLLMFVLCRGNHESKLQQCRLTGSIQKWELAKVKEQTSKTFRKCLQKPWKRFEDKAFMATTCPDSAGASFPVEARPVIRQFGIIGWRRKHTGFHQLSWLCLKKASPWLLCGSLQSRPGCTRRTWLKDQDATGTDTCPVIDSSENGWTALTPSHMPPNVVPASPEHQPL